MSTPNPPPSNTASAFVKKPRVPGDPAMAVTRPPVKKPPPPRTQMACLCAPTTHAGSFRCRFHRGSANQPRFSCSPSTSVVESQSDASSPASCDTVRPPLSPTSGNAFGNTAQAPEKVVRRLMCVPRIPSNHKPIRNFQARPSRLGRMIVAIPTDASTTVDEKSSVTEEPSILLELANEQVAMVDSKVRRL